MLVFVVVGGCLRIEEEAVAVPGSFCFVGVAAVGRREGTKEASGIYVKRTLAGGRFDS